MNKNRLFILMALVLTFACEEPLEAPQLAFSDPRMVATTEYSLPWKSKKLEVETDFLQEGEPAWEDKSYYREAAAGSRSPEWSSAPKLQAELVLPSVGVYEVHVRVNGPTGGSNSFYWGVNGVLSRTVSVGDPQNGTSGNWEWVKIYTLETSSANESYRFIVGRREGGFKLDKISVNYVGEPEPSLLLEAEYPTGSEGNPAWEVTDHESIRAGDGKPSQDGATAPRLNYQVDFPEAGSYLIEALVLAPNDGANSVFFATNEEAYTTRHFKSSTAWQWVKLGTLAAMSSTASNVLRIARREQIIEIDKIRISFQTGAADPNARLLFRSGFEGSTQVVDHLNAHTITGEDGDFSWDTDLPQRTPPKNNNQARPRFFYITGKDNPDKYVDSRLETVTGPKGNPTRALYMGVKEDYPEPEGDHQYKTRNEFSIYPPLTMRQGYVSYWIKFQDNLKEIWRDGAQDRMVMEWKESGPSHKDGAHQYRFNIHVRRINGRKLVWQMGGVNYTETSQEGDWSIVTDEEVVVGEWFRIEVFWKQGSGDDGRLWLAINGEEVADYQGRLHHVSNPIQDINAWSPFKIYYGQNWIKDSSTVGLYQWVDDIEMWSAPPYAID